MGRLTVSYQGRLLQAACSFVVAIVHCNEQLAKVSIYIATNRYDGRLELMKKSIIDRVVFYSRLLPTCLCTSLFPQ